MKLAVVLTPIFALALLLLPAVPVAASIEKDFLQPPDDARPWAYWFWINGNITREGITADLEAMARVGIGGVLIMEVANSRNMAPEGPVKFAGPEWKEMFRHVVREADRLGLQVNMNNDAGWTGSGGPWVTPEQSMKQVVATTTPVAGGKRVDMVLDRPKAVEGLYGDIAVYAIPKPGNGRTGNKDEATSSAAIEITDNMASDGRLKWDAPEGEWVVARLGYTSTGQKNKPAPESGHGLEVDKFDADALEFHFNALIGNLAEVNKDLVGKSFVSTHIDSWEVGWQNWSDNLTEEFRKRRGYDLMPWLPELVGISTGTSETTRRFQRDFALTCAELTDDYYAAAMRKLANDKGLTFTLEGYGPRGFMNPLTYSVHADVPVSEFWIDRWDAWHLLSSRLMASVAHVYGKPIVAAESFTSGGNTDAFTQHPYSVKTTGDWAMSEGVNKFIFHRTVHDPWTHLVPGMSFAGFGWNLDRNQTWYEQGKGYMSYLARCQWILQQGKFVADVCRLVPDGETRPHVPGMHQIPKQFEALPAGYNYDYISDKALLEEVNVENGELVTRAGMRYKVLQLPQYTTMTVELAQKISALVEQGATVVGPKPAHTPGLSNFPQSEEALREIADKVWNQQAEHHVIVDVPIGTVLTESNVLPDFQFKIDPPHTKDSLRSIMRQRGKRRPRAPEPPVMPTLGLNWIHRSLPGGEFYFVANPQHRDVNALCTFRVSEMRPEFWYPETGEIRTPAVFTTGVGVQVLLELGPAEAVFVVFRDKVDTSKQIVEVKRGDDVLFDANTLAPPKDLPAVWVQDGALQVEGRHAGRYDFTLGDEQTETVEVSEPAGATAIEGTWRVEFQAGRGAPDATTFTELLDWTKHEEEGIKYFSGTATYHTSFETDAKSLTSGTRWKLDLGTVHTMAEVRLNGKELVVLWKPPFETDVTDALQLGRNELEIKVTNLWPNRMIGDEQYPDDSTPDGSWLRGRLNAWPNWIKNRTARPDQRRITFTTFKHFQKDAQLIPSGLLGPVRLQQEQNIPVN